MNCRFYGHNGMFGRLISQGGNECALVRTAYSPCWMEMKGLPIDETTCPVVKKVAHYNSEEVAALVELSDADRAQRLIEARP